MGSRESIPPARTQWPPERCEDRRETIADGVVHAVGIVLGVVGSIALIVMAVQAGDRAQLVAVSIYLGGLLAMLGFSAAYNLWPVSPVKWWLRRLDHSAIYLLIAGTYTAFLLPLQSLAAAALLGVNWLAALAGTALKIAWPFRFDRISVGLCLLMGWSGLAALPPLGEMLPRPTLLLIAAGGVLYTVGVVFHAWRQLRFQNAIWHGFVLAAALCHYAAVLTTVVDA
jgi:hemolysin III